MDTQSAINAEKICQDAGILFVINVKERSVMTAQSIEILYTGTVKTVPLKQRIRTKNKIGRRKE